MLAAWPVLAEPVFAQLCARLVETLLRGLVPDARPLNLAGLILHALPE